MAAPWSIYAKSDAPAGNYALVTTVTTPFTLTAVVNKADRATSTPSDTDILDATLSVQPQVVPAKPTGLTATGGDASITLGWDDPDDNSITGYEYFQAWEAKLTASDGAVNDEFGYSVAVDGDTMVVGAYRDDNGSNSGAAYVFVREAGVWSQAAKLTASDGAATDEFGHSVAVDGDTGVVGTHQDNDNGTNSGSAYLFTKPKTDGWTSATQTAKLTASDGAGFDVFGYSVAVDGDTVVVGAYRDDDNGFGSGSAYLFTKPDNSGWATDTETAKLTASDGAVDDYFGYSVAMDGDTVVVGAYWNDGNDYNYGSAYAFTISTWTAIPNSETGGENATSYTLTGLTGGVTYTHWVRAVNSTGASNASNPVTITAIDVDEAGTVSFTSSQPQVGTELTASLSDPDGEVTEVGWQWASSATADGAFSDLSGNGAATASYTPQTADID